MAKMPPEVLEYLRSIGRKYGKLGGKRAAKNMTAAERSARAKKASMAAAKKRTVDRLARRERAEAETRQEKVIPRWPKLPRVVGLAPSSRALGTPRIGSMGPANPKAAALGALQWPRFQVFKRPDHNYNRLTFGRAGGKECQVASVWRNGGFANGCAS